MPSLNNPILPILLASGLPVYAEVTTNSGNVAQAQASETQLLVPIMVYGRQKDDTVESTPQSVNVYTQDDFENTTVDSIGDMLRQTPNATKALGTSMDMFADDYLIRGFGAEQSINGLGFRQTDHPTDLANVERIEVLKGPSSVLYGQMEPGGTINVVTKQPLDYNYADAKVEYGSHDYKRVTLDVTGPLNDKIRARLNLAYQDRESFVDFWEYNRFFVAPNITMDLTDKTNLTIEGSYSQNEWTAIPGGAPIEGAVVDNPNGKYAKSFNTAFNDSFTDRDSYDINARLTHAITDKIDARMSYTFTHNAVNSKEYVPFGLADDFRTLSRLIFVLDDATKKDHEVILDLGGEFDTGPLTHKFIVGTSYRKSETFRPNQLYSVDDIDLYNPQYSAAVMNKSTLMRDRTLHQDDKALAGFVQDRITVAQRLHLLAGLRYTDSEQLQTNVTHQSGGDSEDMAVLNETNWSTQAGLIVDLTDSSSLFASRTDSFVPQQGTTSGLQPLKAEKSIQYETGIRIAIGDLQVDAAGFVIKKENMAIDDPLDDDFDVAQGEARSMGGELSVKGYITPDWFMNAAYGYTDTEVKNSDDPELEGKRFVNVPLHTATLQNRYHIRAVPGLSFGGTITYVGERPGDNENSFTLPNYTRVDLATYYAVTDNMQVDLLVDNVLDEEIYFPGSFSGVVRETGRSYQARLKIFF